MKKKAEKRVDEVKKMFEKEERLLDESHKRTVERDKEIIKNRLRLFNSPAPQSLRG